MTPLSEVHAGAPGVLIYSAAFLLTAAQLAALIFAVQIVRSRKLILLSALHALFGLAALFLLMYANWEQQPDAVSEAMQAAGRIGVTVSIKGAIPEHSGFRALLAQAIEQCAANTVRHAGEDRVTVRITAQESQITAAFTNNGRPPASPVKATGGLAILRTHTEQAGGDMTIESEPVFRLTVTIPNR